MSLLVVNISVGQKRRQGDERAVDGSPVPRWLLKRSHDSTKANGAVEGTFGPSL